MKTVLNFDNTNGRDQDIGFTVFLFKLVEQFADRFAGAFGVNQGARIEN
jgi:hypothetical protein